MLYASECWVVRTEEHSKLLRNERAMIRWICGVNTQEHTDIAVFYSKLGITHLDVILGRNRLRWYGHTYCSHSWIKKCQTLAVVGTRGRGRLRKTWIDNII